MFQYFLAFFQQTNYIFTCSGLRQGSLKILRKREDNPVR